MATPTTQTRSKGGFLARLGAAVGGVSVLTAAFAISVSLHAIVLSTRFVMPPPKPAERDRGLEVVLVNARHARAPDKADVLAQANLDGGGTTEEAVRPKTPLPPKDNPREGDALIEAKKRTAQPTPPRQEVLTRKDSPAQVAAARPQPEPSPTPEPKLSGMDLLDSAAAIARLEAQIDRRLEEYAKRPRKKFIGARTREYRFAQYEEAWRQKIERIGNLNYPDAARGRVYGSLLLYVVINANGQLVDVKIERSSGHKVLDEAAINIVKLAAPFAEFPPNIRGEFDQLVITRTWTFTNADRVRTE